MFPCAQPSGCTSSCVSHQCPRTAWKQGRQRSEWLQSLHSPSNMPQGLCTGLSLCLRYSYCPDIPSQPPSILLLPKHNLPRSLFRAAAPSSPPPAGPTLLPQLSLCFLVHLHLLVTVGFMCLFSSMSAFPYQELSCRRCGVLSDLFPTASPVPSTVPGAQ